MKYLKLYEDFENQNQIHEICEKYGITNYTINDDGTIDVDGDVDLSDKNLTKIPLKFNKVSGYFYCINNKLTSLDGCPSEVDGGFYCYYNQLTSLEGAPNSIGGSFNCSSNQLTSLEGVPNSIGGDFNCNSNQLKSLEGSPNSIGASFYCKSNQLTSLEGAPNSISGTFDCASNQLYTLFNIPDIDFNKIHLQGNPIISIWILFDNRPNNFLELFNYYEPVKFIDGEWTIILEVLNQVLYETGNEELPLDIEKDYYYKNTILKYYKILK